MNINQMLVIQKSPTEEELLTGCRKGKLKSQRALYDRTSPKMLGICSRYIKDREEAEHVMIGGMVKVFEKIAQFKGDGSFEGWIRRIIVNECLTYLRKNRNMSVEVSIDHADVETQGEMVDSQFETEELVNMI
ncbi:MAG: sigma-70 family RNA polymerase sigma factor, partial [Cyclobacteriaceae bacterium]|nr:sigma-70 family RNA polymerase sigma factor [Cyclobacteriaceae bacterium HetDA_MAG_MS6]